MKNAKLTNEENLKTEKHIDLSDVFKKYSKRNKKIKILIDRVILIQEKLLDEYGFDLDCNIKSLNKN